jgi:uncharacterized membrane protein YedE/YeeE
MSAWTTSFTPWTSLFGGALVGLSAVLVMLFFGRIAGISGIALQVVRPFAARDPGDWGWRIAFLIGLAAAPVFTALATGTPVQQTVSGNLPVMALAGLLVGFGTSLGSGCTSGHGVCGLARLSYRSLVSVLTFMAVAVATVFVLRHLVGGGS